MSLHIPAHKQVTTAAPDFNGGVYLSVNEHGGIHYWLANGYKPPKAAPNTPIGPFIHIDEARMLLAQQPSAPSSEPADIAAAERERIAQHFDSRDKGVGGFYDPHEPAEIIRAMGAAHLMANGPEKAAKWCAIHQHYKPCEHTRETAQTASVAGLVHEWDDLGMEASRKC